MCMYKYVLSFLCEAFSYVLDYVLPWSQVRRNTVLLFFMFSVRRSSVAADVSHTWEAPASTSFAPPPAVPKP